MSFPTAVKSYDEALQNEEKALLLGVMTDTKKGYIAVKAITDCFLGNLGMPVDFIRKALQNAGFGKEVQDSVLSSEWINQGKTLVVRFKVYSEELGCDVARLMTDAVRSLLESEFNVCFGLSNGGTILCGRTREDVFLEEEKTVDTKFGSIALQAVSEAFNSRIFDPEACVAFVKRKLKEAGAGDDILNLVLRAHPVDETKAIAFDFKPFSVLGQQIALLMDDAGRKILEGNLGLSFGIANCCKIVAGKEKEDVEISYKRQILWQNQRDC